jgi:trehalose 6-phosphate phosphatase
VTIASILARAQREVLAQFAWSNVLLAFDYDGTLAPIVGDPGRAVMRSETRELLWQVSRLYPTIVISGRAQDDAIRRLRGSGVSRIVGNHGLEPWRGTDALCARVRLWHASLRRALASQQGVHIEDKIFSLAVHYRRSRRKKQVRAAILQAVAALDAVRIIAGKQVVNVLSEDAPHKGVALERQRQQLGCDTAIYVGDDEADEDVFVLAQPGRLLTIRVGASRASAATYHIPHQRSIDELLQALMDERRAIERPRLAIR